MNYYQKYIKYKMKYRKLQNEIQNNKQIKLFDNLCINRINLCIF